MSRTEPAAAPGSISPRYQGRDPETVHRPSLLPWSAAEHRLRAARTYWVVTTGADGWPHPRPLWGLWEDGALSFSVLRSTRIARNLDASPKAAIHLEDGEDVLIVDGTVEEVGLESMPALYEAWGRKYGEPGGRD